MNDATRGMTHWLNPPSIAELLTRREAEVRSGCLPQLWEQRGCWRLIGPGYIASTHKPGDRCETCGFGKNAEWSGR